MGRGHPSGCPLLYEGSWMEKYAEFVFPRKEVPLRSFIKNYKNHKEGYCHAGPVYGQPYPCPCSPRCRSSPLEYCKQLLNFEF